MRATSAGCSAAGCRNSRSMRASPAPTATGPSEREGVRSVTTERLHPSYCMPSKSIRQQIDEGIEFHRNRYRTAQSVSGLFPVVFQHLRPAGAAEGALRRGPRASRRGGHRRRHAPRLRRRARSSTASPGWPATAMSPSNTASNRPYDATLRAVNRGHDFDVRPPRRRR